MRCGPRAAGALPGSLTRIGTAEGWAERTYRGTVEAQRAADATGITRPSPVAEAALGAVVAAGTEQVRGEAWRAAQADKPVVAMCHVMRRARRAMTALDHRAA